MVMKVSFICKALRSCPDAHGLDATLTSHLEVQCQKACVDVFLQ